LLGLLLCVPQTSTAAPYFEDGFLGLTQGELHAKLGMPQAVRDRKSALRVFTYYPITDWATYFSKLVSPENGEDVYTFTRGGTEIRYSFSYTADPNDDSEHRSLFVRLVDIELSPPAPLAKLPALIPEFRPSADASAPAFRSKERGKEQLDWRLSYQLFSMRGLPDRLTPNVLIDRVEIGAQSLRLVTSRQRHTHEPMMNPYSSEFARQGAAPAPSAKPIPVPQYAE
jgi:hypothetical protein